MMHTLGNEDYLRPSDNRLARRSFWARGARSSQFRRAHLGKRGLLPASRPSGHNCERLRVVVPNKVLFRQIARHDSAPTCRQLSWGRLKTPRAQRRDHSTWEEYQGGHSMRILNTASARFLLATATKSNQSMSLDKMSH